MAAEPAVALRKRVVAACVEIMGCPAEYCDHVIGPIEIVPCGWTIQLFNGDPTENMVARQVVDLVARRWKCIPDPQRSSYEICTINFPSGTAVTSANCGKPVVLAQL